MTGPSTGAEYSYFVTFSAETDSVLKTESVFPARRLLVSSNVTKQKYRPAQIGDQNHIRHSRMLLAGIQARAAGDCCVAGFPPKACGNDVSEVGRFFMRSCTKSFEKPGVERRHARNARSPFSDKLRKHSKGSL